LVQLNSESGDYSVKATKVQYKCNTIPLHSYMYFRTMTHYLVIIYYYAFCKFLL